MHRQIERAGVAGRIDCVGNRYVVVGLQDNVGGIQAGNDRSRRNFCVLSADVGIGGFIDIGQIGRFGTGRHDHYVLRFEQQRPGSTIGRRQIRAAAVRQAPLARDLGEAPVTAFGATGGHDLAVETRHLLGPDDDRAAVARGDRAGVDGRVRRDVGAPRQRHRAAALEVAADQRRAAARVARDVDIRAGEQADLLAQHMDRAAGLAGVVARGIQRARDRDDARVAAHQDDLTVLLDDGVGLDDARHVDDVVDDALRRHHRQHDGAAVGDDPARVGDQRAERIAVLVDDLARDSAVDRRADQLVAIEVEREGVARRQGDAAEPRGDGARVLDARRDEGREAAVGDRDHALVDHHGVGIGGTREVDLTVGGDDEVVVRSGHQTGDVDARVGAEQDAIRVEQKDLAVGGQRAENGGTGRARDAV